MKAVGWLTSGIVTSPFFPGGLRNVVIRKWCGGGMLGSIFPHVRIQSNKLKVGEGSYFNEDCKVYNQHGTVILGNDVAVAFGAMFVTTTHDHSDSSRRAGEVSGGDIEVGDGSWIGANAVVLPGCKIGAGTVVAAGAVVAGNLEPNCLYGGIPAKLIKRLPA